MSDSSERVRERYLARIEARKSLFCVISATWGPETELGYPVYLEVKVELENLGGDYSLSMIGDLRVKGCEKLGLAAIHAGGQCLDTAEAHLKRCGLKCKTLSDLVPIWKRWHNNTLRPGTSRQEEVIREYKKRHPEWHYDFAEARKILSERGLLFDGGYDYGSSWITEEIPHEVLVDLCSIMAKGLKIEKE